MSEIEFPSVPQVVGQARIVKRGTVPVALRWQRWHDGWRNADRDLRWYGACIVCGRNVWAFDDGENDPRGVLGDNALWSVSEEDGPASRTCAICANEHELYDQARLVIRTRPVEEWAALVWPESVGDAVAAELEAELGDTVRALGEEMAARAERRTYRIVRRYFNDHIEPEVIDHGLTLEEAQAHCKDPETSSRTATNPEAKARTDRFGPWFDGYEAE